MAPITVQWPAVTTLDAAHVMHTIWKCSYPVLLEVRDITETQPSVTIQMKYYQWVATKHM